MRPPEPPRPPRGRALAAALLLHAALLLGWQQATGVRQVTTPVPAAPALAWLHWVAPAPPAPRDAPAARQIGRAHV